MIKMGYVFKLLYIFIKWSVYKYYSVFNKKSKSAIKKVKNRANNNNDVIYMYSIMSTLSA